MKLVFAVYDRKAACYSAPFFDVAKGSAMRNFKTEVNSGNSQSAVAAYPEDFDLYEFGEFDEVAGRFGLYDKPELVCNGGSLRNVPTPPSAEQ